MKNMNCASWSCLGTLKYLKASDFNDFSSLPPSTGPWILLAGSCEAYLVNTRVVGLTATGPPEVGG